MATPNFLLAGTDFPIAAPLAEIIGHSADVVILPTAAAFTGLAESAISLSESLGDQRAEALLVGDREAANTDYFADRIAHADAVVLADGSPLHFRTTIRDTAVHTALNSAHLIVTLGSVATVLGTTMIDPRGGAPTTGLDIISDCVVCSDAPTLARTRELLHASDVLRVIAKATAWRRMDGLWLEV